MRKPRPYQELAIDYVADRQRCNLFMPMGFGKTATTLLALYRLSYVEDVFPVLVLGPLRVVSSTWPEEVEKWAELQHLRVVVVTGTVAERRKALRTPADIYCMNYENLPWLREELGDEWPFVTVVADECTKLKGFRTRQGTQRARALGEVAHTKVRRYIGLTGTPAPNGLVDLWGQMWFVDAGKRLGRSFSAFTSRWFQSLQVGADRHAVQLLPLPFAQEQVQERIGDVCMSLKPEDWFDLREPIHTVVPVDLPPKARSIYKEMEREFFTMVGSREVEAHNAASKFMKLRQITSGAVYVTDDDGTDTAAWAELHPAKIEALESIIEEANGAPVLVAYQFKSDLARLLKAFPKGRALDKSPKTIDEWNAGKIPVLFCHPKSAGHGLNLQHGGNILAFFSHDWNLEERLQVIERIGPVRQAQAGYDRPVFIYDIVARGTIDELVLARHETKRAVQDILMEAMEARKARTE